MIALELFSSGFPKPDEVEMMSVPLPISEGVSVVEDPVKVARGEAWADLSQCKTELHNCHLNQSGMIDGPSLMVVDVVVIVKAPPQRGLGGERRQQAGWWPSRGGWRTPRSCTPRSSALSPPLSRSIMEVVEKKNPSQISRWR